MHASPSLPTLLVFTLGPRREGLRRRMLPARSAHLEREIHRRGLAEALAAGRSHGLRIVVATPQPLDLPADVVQVEQRGRSFGERLGHAVRDCAAHPGQPMLVVGTDTPGLAPEHLERCLEHLAGDPSAVAVGPSPDGGFYLLAFTGALERELSRVRWCRRDTLSTLLAALAETRRPVLRLAPLRDLDRRADLERWLAERSGAGGRWRGLARRLAEALAALRRPAIAGAAPLPHPAFVPAAPGRSPPG